MYAVLGAAGNVGREVAAVLRRADKAVTAVVHDTTDGVPPGCSIFRADIRDPGALSKAIVGAEAVHVIVPTGRPDGDVASAMPAAIHSIASALATVRPARVLAVSDYGAQRRYGAGMASIFHEMEARLSELPVDLVLLRSAEHFGNWGRMARRLATSPVLPSMHVPLNKPFPMVAGRDVGRIAGEMLLEQWPAGRRIIHVEGPRRYSAEDVAATFSGLFGQAIVAAAVDRSDWVKTLTAAGVTESTAGRLCEFFDARNGGLTDVDPPDGEIRRGPTELADVLRGLLPADLTTIEASQPYGDRGANAKAP